MCVLVVGFIGVGKVLIGVLSSVVCVGCWWMLFVVVCWCVF